MNKKIYSDVKLIQVVSFKGLNKNRFFNNLIINPVMKLHERQYKCIGQEEYRDHGKEGIKKHFFYDETKLNVLPQGKSDDKQNINYLNVPNIESNLARLSKSITTNNIK